jgi:hypothetical protein
MADSEELWETIYGFPQYEVSSHGRIKHKDRDQPRKLGVNQKGFPVVLLSMRTSSARYLRQVNRLVAEAFLRPPLFDDMTAVWHRDGDLENCYVENLMWDRRDRVIEWNRMHRTGKPYYITPHVKNNRTGELYRDAYDCAMQEGELESTIMKKIENNPAGIYDDHARYRYVPDADLDNPLR